MSFESQSSGVMTILSPCAAAACPIKSGENKADGERGSSER